MKNYIKLTSHITNHWLWDDPVKFQWWLIILFEINTKKKEIKLGNKVVKLKQNYSANTIRTWAALFKCSTKAAINFLKLVEDEGLIRKEVLGSGRYSITIIILNKTKKLSINQ